MIIIVIIISYIVNVHDGTTENEDHSLTLINYFIFANIHVRFIRSRPLLTDNFLITTFSYSLKFFFFNREWVFPHFFRPPLLRYPFRSFGSFWRDRTWRKAIKRFTSKYIYICRFIYIYNIYIFIIKLTS